MPSLVVSEHVWLAQSVVNQKLAAGSQPEIHLLATMLERRILLTLDSEFWTCVEDNESEELSEVVLVIFVARRVRPKGGKTRTEGICKLGGGCMSSTPAPACRRQ